MKATTATPPPLQTQNVEYVRKFLKNKKSEHQNIYHTAGASLFMTFLALLYTMKWVKMKSYATHKL
jgi:predicted metal-dependent RNase